MSKIGKKQIVVPSEVTLALTETAIVLKNKKGELTVPLLPGVIAKLTEGILTFSLVSDYKQSRSNWGTLRALVQNAIQGLTQGFNKTLILEGVGYRIVKEGNDLTLNLGFSHPIKYKTPAGITLEVDKNSILRISGVDKALVGQVAAEIRALKKPEPYKGKGFRYENEVVRRKAGKKAAAATA